MGFEHYRRIDLMRDQTESHFVKLLQQSQKPLEPAQTMQQCVK